MERNSKVGVHQAHCCAKHGCKYGDEDCPVVHNMVKQDGPCDVCGEGCQEVWLVECRELFSNDHILMYIGSTEDKALEYVNHPNSRFASKKPFYWAVMNDLVDADDIDIRNFENKLTYYDKFGNKLNNLHELEDKYYDREK